ncbi:MAG: hypothetical protein ACYCZJ_10030 [Sulfuriferula sp.]
MDWIPLIASTVRLIDLHDSDRVAGDSASRFNLYRENRPGNHDGLWLDVGLTIIEYLRERENEVAGGFVSGAELQETLTERIAGLTQEDVGFVLSALTVPAELWFVERLDTGSRPINSTKETNLIERSRTADAYRLSPAGRTAAGLAANVRDIAYIAGSAKNLLTAIKARDFWKITELSSSIIDVLRAFRLEIESRRESGRRDEVQEFFVKRGEVIREQIEEASQIMLEANEFLSLASTRDEFLTWVATMDRLGKPSFGHGYAIEHLRRVAGQTLKLLESFTQLVEESISLDSEPFQPISFIDFSAALASKPFQDNLYMALIRSFGPTQYKQPMPCPFDFFGVIEPERMADIREEDTDNDGVEDTGVRAIDFVAEHSAAIVAELRKGPFSLNDALQRGWIQLNAAGASDISALLGTYCDPSMLGADLNISVRLSDQREVFTSEEIGRLTVNGLVMVLEDKQ